MRTKKNHVVDYSHLITIYFEILLYILIVEENRAKLGIVPACNLSFQDTEAGGLF